ncbi:MAG: 4'-phosphopantetheinyl transferase family protein [Actinomycetota bacterium]
MQSIWQPPPADLALSNHEIHVWLASLDQPAQHRQQLLATLAPEERLRAERFHFELDRNRFIVGRGILRTILGRYLQQEPSWIQFRYGGRGKPYLATQPPDRSLCFNLSHSQGMALYALSRGQEIGIDLEFIRPLPDVEAIAQYCFSAQEKANFLTLPAREQKVAFFQVWTRKEAYLKAIGDGLAFPLDQFEVSLLPGEPAKLLSIQGCSEAAKQWLLQDLSPAPNYAATLAVAAGDWQLRYWLWNDAVLA